jgi:FAD:protein FMN transferase
MRAEIDRRNFFSTLSRTSEPSGYWLHVGRQAMACRFEVTLSSEQSEAVEVAQQALQYIDHLESILSVFRESSEISLVNRGAHANWMEVSSLLYSLLKLSQQVYEETGGAFDISAGSLSRCWGFVRREGRLPEQGEIEESMNRVGMGSVKLADEKRSVSFSKEGIEINFGAIGKGFALDKVSSLLVKEGVQKAFLNAGGSSMFALGRGNGRGWVAGIRDPRDKTRRMAVVTLRNCGMATSGNEEQYFEVGEERFSHIIDPRTGWPSKGVTSVTVLTESAALSDALSTAFHVGGRDLAEDYCRRHPGVVAIILNEGETKPIVIGKNRDCEVEIF